MCEHVPPHAWSPHTFPHSEEGAKGRPSASKLYSPQTLHGPHNVESAEQRRSQALVDFKEGAHSLWV